MDISAISQQPAAAQPQSRSISEMSGEDFFKVLIAQLQQQDPMEPMDSDQMLSQMATIRELESSTKLTEVLGKLADSARIDQAATVIGKYVRGGGEDYAGISGMVTGVRLENGKVVLELDNGDMIPLDAVTYVADADQDTTESLAPVSDDGAEDEPEPATETETELDPLTAF